MKKQFTLCVQGALDNEWWEDPLPWGGTEMANWFAYRANKLRQGKGIYGSLGDRYTRVIIKETKQP